MSATASVRVDVQLVAGTWTEITSDVVIADGLRISYGIDGNGPTDCVARSGEALFEMDNSAQNSGGVVGYYSPLHASVRTGWTHGIPLRITFTHGDDSAVTLTSLTQAGGTATATKVGHGFTDQQWVTIAGATPAGYNGVHQITVPTADTFTYAVDSGLASPATGTITATTAYVKFRGKLAEVDPAPGQYLSRQVSVVGYDGIFDLVETDAREVTLQISKTETELVTAVLDSLVSTAQPVARDFDTGVDSFPYAFDDLQGGVKALSVIKDVCVGAFALYFQKGDGTHVLLSRNTRATGASVYTFTDMHGLDVPSSLQKVYNLVRVTIRPKVVFATATEELYTLPTGASIAVSPSSTQEVWTDYTDPNDRQVPIGGANVVTALVGGTHYTANSQADGGGSNMTADITPTLTPFASTAKWSLQNTHATATAYMTQLKVIGKGVRNPGPQTYQSYAAKDYGVRPLHIELRYQSDGLVAQSYADYVRAQYEDITNQIDAIAFVANDSSAFMTQALAREPGDLITISETVTGVSSVVCVIQSVELDVTPKPWIVCRWQLSPAAPFQAWLAGITGRSEAGVSTIPGW